MICPPVSGEGPPTRIVTFHPVCSMIDFPTVASVGGILSMPLDELEQCRFLLICDAGHVLTFETPNFEPDRHCLG